ncbi:WapI family immunity protein [Chitiniphilus eburneus]|uniref:Uncharacterized protein n=1 Tax=Chitiniphilus eburneus TaxID=2571148 RepID=A0A4U0Q5G0_9NEIS|nr:hypothetical protein [Chitiniphilus eburneus]TJZ76315.1 hypothetical protein FAZ21_05945 [Chitiniphilus eburneus]
MALRLINSARLTTVQIDAMSYQFPQSLDEWDGNWLCITGSIEAAEGAWKFRDPCLTTFELEELANWFTNLESEKRPCFFTEPCIHFRVVSSPAPGLELVLSHECAPPWQTGEDRLDGWALFFPFSENSPTEMKATKAIMERFPVRNR